MQTERDSWIRATQCCMHSCLMRRGHHAAPAVKAELSSCVACKTAVLRAIMTLTEEPCCWNLA